MTRASNIFSCGLLLVACGCSQGNRQPLPAGSVDCSVANAYEFRNISDFSYLDSTKSGWYTYADATPHGVVIQQVIQLDAPGRCGDTLVLELVAHGFNFYGAGFGYYQNYDSPADGTGYQGISFWARSPGSSDAGNSDKTFLFYVDDGRTFKKPGTPDGGLLNAADGAAGQDFDRDGLLGPGDIVNGTYCRLPPPQVLGDPACYYGGVQPPATPTRVPAPDECGNQFHVSITTTEAWQLFLIPWNELVQWPCPNRLEGGINGADIRQLQIKPKQGTNYDIWLDNIAFYRLRADAGS